jgi:hypothetical protein
LYNSSGIMLFILCKTRTTTKFSDKPCQKAFDK